MQIPYKENLTKPRSEAVAVLYVTEQKQVCEKTRIILQKRWHWY